MPHGSCKENTSTAVVMAPLAWRVSTNVCVVGSTGGLSGASTQPDPHCLVQPPETTASLSLSETVLHFSPVVLCLCNTPQPCSPVPSALQLGSLILNPTKYRDFLFLYYLAASGKASLYFL